MDGEHEVSTIRVSEWIKEQPLSVERWSAVISSCLSIPSAYADGTDLMLPTLTLVATRPRRRANGDHEVSTIRVSEWIKERPLSETGRFKTELLSGRKDHAVEMPFDPSREWNIQPQLLWRGRRGYKVIAKVNGISFESAVVPR